MSALADYLRDSKILILGMGREGRSSLRYIRTHVPDADVTIADRVDPKIDGVPGYFGEEYLAHLGEFDLVLKSPGIPFVGVEVPQQTEITCQTDLFLRFAGCVSIGITGTKGKRRPRRSFMRSSTPPLSRTCLSATSACRCST